MVFVPQILNVGDWGVMPRPVHRIDAELLTDRQHEFCHLVSTHALKQVVIDFCVTGNGLLRGTQVT
jgi:hypothetical protein